MHAPGTISGGSFGTLQNPQLIHQHRAPSTQAGNRANTCGNVGGQKHHHRHGISGLVFVQNDAQVRLETLLA
jgi:hypothetical protein